MPVGDVGTVAIHPQYNDSFRAVLVSQDSVHISQDLQRPYHAFPGGTTIYIHGGQTYSLFEQI